LYIGAVGKYSKDSTSLNENIANKSKLGRFGYGTCHHIGALSAKVLGSYDNTAAPRYELWAAEMFEARKRRLKIPVCMFGRVRGAKTTGDPFRLTQPRRRRS